MNENLHLVDKKCTKTSLGCLSKAWYKNGKGELLLVKGNSDGSLGGVVGLEPFSERLSFLLGKLLGLNVVEYVLEEAIKYPEINVYDCDYVSVCKNTDKNVQRLPFCRWADLTSGKEVSDYFGFITRSDLDLKEISKMLIFDAIIGNTDRHLNNFDILYDGKCYFLAPILDNGASMLSLFSDKEIKMWNSIGPDKSKPFKSMHSQQIQLIKNRWNPGILFNCDKESLFREWCTRADSVFALMSEHRVACIKNYVYNRLDYLDEFNAGGNVHALDVF